LPDHFPALLFLSQRRKARAFCLDLRGFISGIIRQPLPFGPFDNLGDSLGIFDAELGAIAVSEIEFGQIAAQVRLAD
jgi:hypothetical protein